MSNFAKKYKRKKSISMLSLVVKTKRKRAKIKIKNASRIFDNKLSSFTNNKNVNAFSSTQVYYSHLFL